MISNNKDNNIIVTFICQPGEMEIKSLLLAYSLRKNLKIDYTPIALIPEQLKPGIDASTNLLFGKLGIETRYFENEFVSNKKKLLTGDRMSNKFFGLSSLESQNKILFLDSDIVCLNTLHNDLLKSELAAKPADYSMQANWSEIYRIACVSYPKTTVKCTVDGINSPPYYNSGVVLIDNNIKREFCNLWNEYFQLFSQVEILNKNLYNPFHRDQLAFALANEKLGITIKLLDELYNFPARIRETIPSDIIFAHYHDCYTIAFRQKLYELFQSFYFEHSEIKNLLKKHLFWMLLADRKILLLKQLCYGNELKKRFLRLSSKLK